MWYGTIQSGKTGFSPFPGPKGRYCNRPWHRHGICQEGISQSEGLLQDASLQTPFMHALYGSPTGCEIPSWHIPWRCHGLLQYRPFGPGKGMTLSSPASDFQEIDFGESDFCNYLFWSFRPWKQSTSFCLTFELPPFGCDASG